MQADLIEFDGTAQKECHTQQDLPIITLGTGNFPKGGKMLWVSYGKITQEGIKGMIANPANRAEAVSKLVEALGGKLISYLC